MSLTVPFQKQTNTLVTALAEKGTPGLILLATIFIIIWIVPIMFIIGIFLFIKDLFPLAVTAYGVFCGVLLFILIFFSYIITTKIIANIIPTIYAETSAMKLMPQAFGGKVGTITGGFAVTSLPKDTAKRRIHQVMNCLVRCIAEDLNISDKTLVRSNIFITKDNQWLSIANDFHENMKGQTPNDRELTIRILVGYFSTGTAFKYCRPILSQAKEDNGVVVWPHRPEPETIKNQGINETIIKDAFEEIEKSHDHLKWIISMPIPYQTNPFKMTCGVLNIDGLDCSFFRDQLKQLLADTAIAAALIGVINRTEDILGGQCQRPADITQNIGGVKNGLEKDFLIDPEDFDPVECPEPSEKFKNALAEIKGLEFLKRITTTDVAEFLREQLRI